MGIPIPIPSPKELHDHIQSLVELGRKWYDDRKTLAEKEGRQSSMLPQVLAALYPNLSRPWSDVTYPSAVWRAPACQISNPESVLGLLTDTPLTLDSGLTRAGQKYVEHLQLHGRTLKNDPTYALTELTAGEQIKLGCTVGYYFDALMTSDILEWELLTLLGSRKGESDPRHVIDHLKCRGCVHRLSDRPVFRPVGRSAAIAISTVVLFRRPEGFAVLLQHRSSKGVAVHKDLWHVAPSFMFQPVVRETVKEYSVIHNVFREYLEELFKVEEATDPPSVISHDYFYGNPNLEYLRSLLANGDAQLLLTGVTVNLLNLRPEICTLLYVESPEWYRKHSTGLDGLDRLELSDEFEASGLSAQPVSAIRRGYPPPAETVPPGAAALFLALETAQELRLRLA
jgi:hypothetical protein